MRSHGFCIFDKNYLNPLVYIYTFQVSLFFKKNIYCFKFWLQIEIQKMSGVSSRLI